MLYCIEHDAPDRFRALLVQRFGALLALLERQDLDHVLFHERHL